MASEPVFEPGRYLTKVNGADYLEVKWRLVWLRNEHPDAKVTTELVDHDGNQAIVRALVELPTGAVASGYGSEAQNNFHNYIEKAETKAIGRALAALGFGTQFCPDFEFGAAQGQVVDAPVNLPGTKGGRAAGMSNNGYVEFNQQATFKQRNLIRALSQEVGITGEKLEELTKSATGQELASLDRRGASSLIEALKERQQRAGKAKSA